MGTTRDALLTKQGMKIAFSLVLEGYEYILTNGDPARCVSAWSGSPFKKSLPGLEVSGNFTQSFRPFQNDLDVPTMRVRVLPEETDQFGRDIFKSKPDFESELTVDFEPTHTPTSIKVKTLTGSLGAAGRVFIGNTAYDFNSTNPATNEIMIDADSSGVLSPFSTDTGNDFAFPGAGSAIASNNISTLNTIGTVCASTSKRSWTGAKCALYVHEVSPEGVWDTNEEAELLFAGTIDNIGEDGDGATVIELIEIRSLVEDATLGENAWSGRPKSGLYFPDGWLMNVSIVLRNPDVAVGDTFITNANAFRFKDVPAGGDHERPAGCYEVEEVIRFLLVWLNGDPNLSDFQWSISYTTSGDNQVVRISSTTVADLILPRRIVFTVRDPHDFGAFGFTPSQLRGNNLDLSDLGANNFVAIAREPIREATTTSLVGRNSRIVLSDQQGQFFDNTEYLPDAARQHAVSGGRWGYFQSQDKFFFGQYTGDQILNIVVTDGILGTAEVEESETRFLDEEVRIRQVILLSGSFSDILTALFCSVSGNGVNHALDILPWGAGIPWSLLGDGWLDSLRDIEQTTNDDALTVVIEEPVKLWDAIKADLMLRAAFIVWKDGGLRVGSLQTPSANTADWTLGEFNKSDQPGQSQQTITNHTKEFLINTVKLEHSRTLDGTDNYAEPEIIVDIASRETYGPSKPLTIKARNILRAEHGNGTSVEHLRNIIGSRLIPPLARPVKRWRRSVSHNIFLAAPGDTVSFSDSFVRNPTSGRRGVQSRGATVLSTSWNLGVSAGAQTANGTIEVLFTEDDRYFQLAPSVATDANFSGGLWSGGLNLATGQLALLNHEYSLTTDPEDGLSFKVGDKVRVTQRNPSNPSGGVSFEDQIASIGINTTPPFIGLADGFGALGNPAYSPGSEYVITYADYLTTNPDQKLFAFQADINDDLIQDEIEANLYGNQSFTNFSFPDFNLPAENHNDEWFGDGKSLHPHLSAIGHRNLNNLVNYRCVNQTMNMQDGGDTISAPSQTVLYSFPFYIGTARMSGIRVRKLQIAPQFQSLGGFARVTVHSSANPPANVNGSWDDFYFGDTDQSVTFQTAIPTTQVHPTQTLVPIRSSHDTNTTWITVSVQGNLRFWGFSKLALGATGLA